VIRECSHAGNPVPRSRRDAANPNFHHRPTAREKNEGRDDAADRRNEMPQNAGDWTLRPLAARASFTEFPQNQLAAAFEVQGWHITREPLFAITLSQPQKERGKQRESPI